MTWYLLEVAVIGGVSVWLQSLLLSSLDATGTDESERAVQIELVATELDRSASSHTLTTAAVGAVGVGVGVGVGRRVLVGRVVEESELGDGERGVRDDGGVRGSRSVTTRTVKRGGTVTDGGVQEDTGSAVGLVRGATTDGESGGCGVNWVGRVTRLNEVETTWERAARRLE
jgi:hypothetical protein